MIAVNFSASGKVELVERPRPSVIDPDDAVVMVTTAAIAPWDVARQTGPGTHQGRLVPGTEFAGTVHEIGSNVAHFDLGDLVIAPSAWKLPTGEYQRFGCGTLDGAHAEFVRVPNADRILVRTTPASEERSLLAGGTLGLGAHAADLAVEACPEGVLAVVGCDPCGIGALATLRRLRRNRFTRIFAVDQNPGRAALAKAYGAVIVDAGEAILDGAADVVISGAVQEGPGMECIMRAARPGGTVIFCEPYGPGLSQSVGIETRNDLTVKTALWPDQDRVRRLAMAVQIGSIDLTAAVSHVMPLDQAAAGYEAAASPAQGVVHKVLLKP
ncbi:MAG: alcohol dehydrogenase catalytic domain-containing protein [Dehalococcoidia bacterium]